MKSIQFLTNRNGTYYFRRSVPVSLRFILNRREIVLTLKTTDFKDACMAALEMSKELDALFDRLKKGAELITPAEQSVSATAVKTRRTQTLLKEALESFNDRKHEDIEWEAAHCGAFDKNSSMISREVSWTMGRMKLASFYKTLNKNSLKQ